MGPLYPLPLQHQQNIPEQESLWLPLILGGGAVLLFFLVSKLRRSIYDNPDTSDEGLLEDDQLLDLRIRGERRMDEEIELRRRVKDIVDNFESKKIV